MRGRFLLSIVITFLVVAGCGSDSSPKNAVTGVRILAARADLPYARPGESVHVQGLVHDGRKSPVTPMRLFWFPAPCVSPLGGSPELGCYPLFEALFPVGVDLTSSFVEASDVTIPIPADAIEKSLPRPGQSSRYAVAYVFMAACAGHLERVPRRSDLGPGAMPIGCFDAKHVQLGPEEFVFGYTRVFVFEERRNAIPSLDGVVFDGKPVDPAAGVTTRRCAADAKTDECKTVELDVLFDDAAAEIDPDNVDEGGKVGRETLYVDWFTSAGKFMSDRKVVFDGLVGRPPKTAIDFSPPKEPGNGTIWAVLHDNRGGTSWIELPIAIE